MFSILRRSLLASGSPCARCLSSSKYDSISLATSLSVADKLQDKQPKLAYNLRSEVLLSLLEFDAAENSATEAISIDPACPFARYIRGCISLKNQNPNSACEDLAIVRQSIPTLHESDQDTVSQDVSDLEAIALTMSLYDTESALARLRQSAENDPGSRRKRHNYVWALMYLQKWEEADRELSHCIDSWSADPEISHYFSRRAVVRLRRGLTEEAHADADEAIRLLEDCAYNYVVRATVFADNSLRRYKDALRDLKLALQLPNNMVLDETYRLLAYCYLRLGKYEKAFRNVKRGLMALVPSDAEDKYDSRFPVWHMNATPLYTLKAVILLRMERREEAFRSVCFALMIDPTFARAYAVRAKVYESLVPELSPADRNVFALLAPLTETHRKNVRRHLAWLCEQKNFDGVSIYELLPVVVEHATSSEPSVSLYGSSAKAFFSKYPHVRQPELDSIVPEDNRL